MTPVRSDSDAVDDTTATPPQVTYGPSWLKAIYVLGPTAAIALFLVWSTSDSQAKHIEQILLNQAEMSKQIAAAQSTLDTATFNMRAFVETQLKAEENRMRVMRQICINTARDNQGMLKCAE